MITKLILISLLVIGANAGTNVVLSDYGIAAASDASCTGVSGSGWFVDRAYGSTCFIRKVLCASNGVLDTSVTTNTAVCNNINEFYIADGSGNCFTSNNAAAITACGVSIHCNQESIAVSVTSDAVFSQTSSQLQMASTSCPMSYNSGIQQYTGSWSILNSEWSACGISRSVVADTTGSSGSAILFEGSLKRLDTRSNREEESHPMIGGGTNVVVTRERCFMWDVKCYYNADGQVTTSYYPSSANVLSQEGQSALTFDLIRTDCSNRANTYSAAVYVNEPVCFQAQITSTWHQDIRVQIRNCYTASDSAGNNMIYPLSRGNRSSGTGSNTDTTFVYDCYQESNRNHEDFSFDAFRYQEISGFGDVNNPDYIQTIYVFCNVNACGITDSSSTDCDTGCPIGGLSGARRKRRAAENANGIGPITKSVVRHNMYVLPAREELVEDDVSYMKYNFLSDTFALGMFAVGCVLAVVAVGLLIVLRNNKNQIKYGVL